MRALTAHHTVGTPERAGDPASRWGGGVLELPCSHDGSCGEVGGTISGADICRGDAIKDASQEVMGSTRERKRILVRLRREQLDTPDVAVARHVQGVVRRLFSTLFCG